MGKRFAGVLIGGLVWLAVGAGPASAADFTVSFDDAVIETGWQLFSLTPGTDGINDVAPPPEDVVRISGTIDDGNIAIPAAGIEFKRETLPLDSPEGSFTVDWEATSGWDGSFDPETGRLDLSGSLRQTISQGSNQCSVGPLPVTLSTENSTALNQGERFTGGLEGEGRLVGRWFALTTEPSGTDCDPEALSCYALHSLATTKGDVALATDRSLKRMGPASQDRCNPPGIVGGPTEASIVEGPGTLGFPGSRTGSYKLKFVAGEDGAHFNISLAVPGWSDRRVHGSPIQFGEASASGAKAFEQLPHPPVLLIAYMCTAGSSGYGDGYTVQMDPGTTATVTLPVSLMAHPWSFDPITPRISIGYFGGSQDLEPPAIGIGGRLGASIRAWVGGQKKRSWSRVKRRRKFTVVGHVNSGVRLAGRKVRLRAETFGGSSSVPLGIARVNRKGNFAKKVKGLPVGGYLIQARLIGAGRGPVCGNTLNVR